MAELATRSAQLIVSNSSLIRNRSLFGGGGISNHLGIATIAGSTFDQNAATGEGGGGIINRGTLSVTNSTFYGNVAASCQLQEPYQGGGILNIGILNISNCTITANFSEQGSGVYNHAIGTANIKSTIIASNYGGKWSGGESPDVFGAFNSQGFNLIGKTNGSTGFTATTDRRGTVAAPLNPRLDFRGLRNNGGVTQTVALVNGSPAIDRGTSAGLSGPLTTDQRGSGFPRTVEKAVANAVGGDGTDIGAFELQ